mmetsp:Transcript_24998/g.75328  ORF Transcript_24998/g.75328 Transcript_24998/m.75328 type:complete len:217 (-) Transcript_24998:177-827(-)
MRQCVPHERVGDVKLQRHRLVGASVRCCPWLGNHVKLFALLCDLHWNLVVHVRVFEDKVDNGPLDRYLVVFRHLVAEALNGTALPLAEYRGDAVGNVLKPPLLDLADMLRVDPVVHVVVVSEHLLLLGSAPGGKGLGETDRHLFRRVVPNSSQGSPLQHQPNKSVAKASAGAVGASASGCRSGGGRRGHLALSLGRHVFYGGHLGWRHPCWRPPCR